MTGAPIAGWVRVYSASDGNFGRPNVTWILGAGGAIAVNMLFAVLLSSSICGAEKTWLGHVVAGFAKAADRQEPMGFRTTSRLCGF